MAEFERPDDTAVVPMVDAVRWQRDYVQSAGAVVAAQILEAVRTDLAAGGGLSALVPETVRFGDLPGLRFMAAVHRLALTRDAPRVAMHLPTLGGLPPGDADHDAFANAVVEALVTHPQVLRRSLGQTPQTNEVARAALLRCALSRLPTARPIRLREVGCSAGLNLRADHLPGVDALEAGPLPDVLDRVGCDLDPVDPLTTEGRVHLTSYVWVDQVERFERLRRALDVAARYPAVIVQEDAAGFVESLSLHPGTTTVIWHSAMWPYLSDDQRQRVLSGIGRLGAHAAEDAMLAHVSWEWSHEPVDPRVSFELVMRTWRGGVDDGRPQLLARGGGHGTDPFLIDGAPVMLSAEPLPA